MASSRDTAGSSGSSDTSVRPALPFAADEALALGTPADEGMRPYLHLLKSPGRNIYPIVIDSL